MSGYLANPVLGGFQHSLDQAFPGRTMNQFEGPGCNAPHAARASAHCTGEAVDIWPDAAHGLSGDEIAQRATQTPGVDEVIWNRRIWRPWNGWQTWPSHYPNGQPTDPHLDHVHVQVPRAGHAPRAARGTPNPATPRRRRRRRTSDAGLPNTFQLASADGGGDGGGGGGGGGGDQGGGGDRIVQGEPTVVLGGEQLMAAHKETPHTGGGKIARGSSTVMVGPKMLDFARIGDPTTDSKNVITGHEKIFVG